MAILNRAWQYEYGFDNDGNVYDFENCSCEAASDGREYSERQKELRTRTLK